MKKETLVLLFLCLLSFYETLGQSAYYKYKLSADIPIGAVIIGAGTVGIIKQKKNQPFTEYEVSELAYNVNKLDYSSIRRKYNKRIHLVSDIGLALGTLSPLLLLSDKGVRKQSKYIVPIGIETLLLTYSLTGLTKELVRRTRPYVYYDEVPMKKKVLKDARASFFSGHTSMSAAGTFFSAMVFTEMYPRSRWKPLVWTGAATLPLGVGFLRYSGGKHFWTDIITGYFIGAAIGVLVPHIHKTNHPPQ